MSLSKKLLLAFTVILFLAACKSKSKPSLAGDDPVEVNDFIDFFPEVKLPYEFNDEMLQKKEKDSLLISHKVFTQFVPDSILNKVFGKTKPKIYPLGKATDGSETYLFAKVVAPSSRAAFILGFDKNNKFVASHTALRSAQDKTITRTTTIDRRYTITSLQTRKNKDGSMSEGKDVYVLNADAHQYMLIMTDALEDKATELINPIDTLPRKNKYSADYSSSKTNLVSIRDGRKADRLSFFIHFEKNDGECTGELKGEAIIKSPTLAEYRLAGDPCILQFRFSNTAVTLKEVEGCGSRRGLRCSFDGSYAKKKEARKKG